MFGMCRGSGSDFGVASSGFGVKPKNCSGYYTIGLLGVQLELGAAASPFEDRDFPSRGSGTIVRDRGLQRAGIGAHRGVSPDLPRQHLLPPGVIPCPGSAGDDIQNNCSLPNRARQLAWIKKIILGVVTLYNMGYYGRIV